MKTILICGTKKTSLSKTFKSFFSRKGFNVLLFSRNVLPTKSGSVFGLDLSKTKTFKNVPTYDISAVIFSQDTGTAFGDFENLTNNEIKQFIDSKILGSILFSRFLLKQKKIKQRKVKLIWTCGAYDLKPKNYMLYHIVNSAIKSFVDELNAHYSDFVEAYYIVTPFIGRTTIGVLYNNVFKKNEKGENPDKLLIYLEKIINSKTKPGIVFIGSSFLK